MYFFFSLIPAMLAAVLGYFFLFSSTRAQGVVKTLGRTLAIWVFVLAALLPVAGGYATYADLPSPGLDDAVDALRREFPELGQDSMRMNMNWRGSRELPARQRR